MEAPHFTFVYVIGIIFINILLPPPYYSGSISSEHWLQNKQQIHNVPSSFSSSRSSTSSHITISRHTSPISQFSFMISSSLGNHQSDYYNCYSSTEINPSSSSIRVRHTNVFLRVIHLSSGDFFYHSHSRSSKTLGFYLLQNTGGGKDDQISIRRLNRRYTSKASSHLHKKRIYLCKLCVSTCCCWPTSHNIS